VYRYLDTNDKSLLESATNTGIPLFDICTRVIEEHLFSMIKTYIKDSDTAGKIEKYLKWVAMQVPDPQVPIPVPLRRI